MSKLQTVAVCGATGQQGGGVVDALLRLGGFNVRALTRDPCSSASKKLAELGVEVVKADFDDLASLRVAFEGADAVFGVTDFWKACGMDPIKELAQGRNLVTAAQAAVVQHFVWSTLEHCISTHIQQSAGVKHFVWSTLEDTRPHSEGLLEPVTASYTVPHFDAKSEVEAYLKEQMPGKWTCVLTSVFFENLLPGAGMGPVKQEDGSHLIVMPVGNAKLAWCATPDIGNVAAAIIAGGPEKFGGKTVPVAGEHLTYPELAERISKVTGKKVAAATPPADAWIETVKGFGVPELSARDLANMCTFYDKVGMTAKRSVDETKAVYPGVQDAEAWLKNNKEALLKAME